MSSLPDITIDEELDNTNIKKSKTKCLTNC